MKSNDFNSLQEVCWKLEPIYGTRKKLEENDQCGGKLWQISPGLGCGEQDDKENHT